LVLTLSFLTCTCAGAQPVVVKPQECRIVLPEAADKVKIAAAEELQRHLRLITGMEVAISAAAEAGAGYRFCVGIPAPGDTRPLAPEEARWVITPEGTYLFGDDERRCGSQFAVYAFLEDQLGVRWLTPEDRGISYESRTTLTLTPGASSWAPTLEGRSIRPSVRIGHHPQRKDYADEFWSFARTGEEHDRYATGERLWYLRMRMGSHTALSYGHAFTNWYDKFGKTHPEFLALNKWGKREPERDREPQGQTAFTAFERETVKLCVSNPAVAQQIVANWVAGGMKSKWVNVCENDMGWGYCRCEGCRKLDVPREGEEFGIHVTDRYIHLANAVARLARQHHPEAGAVMYAYNETERPPRRERLDPNLCIGIVPTTVDLKELEQLYTDWEAVGAKTTFTRPNLPLYYHTTAIPLGAERQMFEVLQLAVKHGAIVADYDSMTGMWPVCGMADYILAKAMSDPAKPFEFWEDHYCAGYGPAAGDVKHYFRYWREDLWEKRILPHLGPLIVKGKYFNLARGVMWSLGDYYRLEDFDRTDAILKEAAARQLGEVHRRHVNELMLANQHARLTFAAITRKGVEGFAHSKALLDFRTEHKHDLAFSWLGLFATETRFGDITGLRTAEQLKQYPLPWVQTALAWRFKLDPKDVGLAEKWQDLEPAQMTDWELMRTDFHWENPYEGAPYPSAELRAQLKDYDGIGWYATQQAIPPQFAGRDIFLYFGAVDESCWVYVNGKLVGQHLFEKPDDWNTPFEIRIDPYLIPEKGLQRISVRVEDRGGAGGIWKRVWLVSKTR
jgi:hypothetical protein